MFGVWVPVPLPGSAEEPGPAHCFSLGHRIRELQRNRTDWGVCVCVYMYKEIYYKELAGWQVPGPAGQGAR